LPHLAYRRPLAREVDRFAFDFLLPVPPRDLPLERFEGFAVDGELMIKRTESIRLALKPN
jgi:hypothetical protein